MKIIRLFLLILIIFSSQAMDKSWIPAYLESEKQLEEKVKVKAEEELTLKLIYTIKRAPDLNQYRKDTLQGLKKIHEGKQEAIAVQQQVKELLMKGANPNVILREEERFSNARFKTSLLIIAIQKGLIGVAKLLIQAGADVNLISDHNETPLNQAIIYGSLPLVNFLLNHRADPNLENNPPEAKTPLMFAVEGKDPLIVSLLLDKGANPFLENKWGKNVLHYVANVESGKRIIEAAKILSMTPYTTAKNVPSSYLQLLPEDLIQKLSSYDFLQFINKTDKSDNTPLMPATVLQRTAFISLLIENGANPSIKNKEGKTALDIAKQLRHGDLIKILSDAQAKQQSQDTP